MALGPVDGTVRYGTVRNNTKPPPLNFINQPRSKQAVGDGTRNTCVPARRDARALEAQALFDRLFVHTPAEDFRIEQQGHKFGSFPLGAPRGSCFVHTNPPTPPSTGQVQRAGPRCRGKLLALTTLTTLATPTRVAAFAGSPGDDSLSSTVQKFIFRYFW